MKLNARQEKFVRNLVNGMSQKDAYLNAGYTNDGEMKTVSEKASRLFKRPEVRNRYNDLLNEILVGIKKKNLWTVEMAIEDLKEAREWAKSEENVKGLVMVVEKLNKISGLYIEDKVKMIDAKIKIDNHTGAGENKNELAVAVNKKFKKRLEQKKLL